MKMASMAIVSWFNSNNSSNSSNNANNANNNTNNNKQTNKQTTIANCMHNRGRGA